ncbi:16730_t:CDS:2, partial [Funneliformis caledonium]
GLQNICKSSEFDEFDKFAAKKLIDTYKEDKRKCTKLLNSHSARMAILQNRFSLLVSTAKSANATINATFTEADDSLRRLETPKNITRATGHSCKSPDQFDTSPDQSEIVPRRLFNQAELDFFVAGPQSSKRNHDSEEGDDTEDYSADQTITGGKNISWVVDGLDIRKKFTEYQLETKLPRTKPEYYDVIFFDALDKSCFLETLEEHTVAQMLNDITEEEKETSNNIEQEIKSLLSEIISRDISMSKKKLKQWKGPNEPSFESEFAVHFVNHMIELMEDTNLLLESMSEGTYIVSVLGPIINKLFIKNKKGWRVKYGETCLKASAKDCNSQKEDDERRSAGRKIDAIITLKEEDEEFSVVEVSGPPSKRDWTHFKGDRMKIVKMLKTLINRLAELRPRSDIRKIKLYAMQSYLHEIIIYEFRLKYSEIYTMKEILRFSFPKTWKDMKEAYDVVMDLLKYERLLSSSSEGIQEFLWHECKDSQKMTTRMIYSPGRRTKKARTT